MKLTLLCSTAVLAATIAITTATVAQQGSAVVSMDLPLKLPAVGNIEKVRQWRFARLQEAQMLAQSTDIRARSRYALRNRGDVDMRQRVVMLVTVVSVVAIGVLVGARPAHATGELEPARAEAAGEE